MQNEQRVALYTRDRSTLTPAQARRVRHHAHDGERGGRRNARIRRDYDARAHVKLRASLAGIFGRGRKATR